jgi:ABC-type polar amino acid transport system ATPase subunit
LNQALGMTVLLVTHERRLADAFAGRILHMADGRLLSTPVDAPALRPTPPEASPEVPQRGTP